MSNDLQWITASFIQNYLTSLKNLPATSEVDTYRVKAEEILQVALKATDEQTVQECHDILHKLISHTTAYRFALQCRAKRDI